MKRYIGIAAIASSLLLMQSCKGFLDVDNPNSLTSESAFNTGADMDATLTGAYHSFYSNFYGLSQHVIFGATCDVSSSESNTDLQNFCKINFTRYDYRWNKWSWYRLYEQISRCNQVIEYSENVEDWGKYDKTQIVAQAKAIRAYDYFQLAMLYGKAPYVDYVADAGDQPAESDWDFLMGKVVEDAQYAYENLPGSYFNNYSGLYNGQYRVTKWFAACVLAKAYMNWDLGQSGKYQYDKALPYYKDIVENGGFSLVADPQDNWTESNENNSESIWEIQNYADNTNEGGRYDGTNNGSVVDHGSWMFEFFMPSFSSSSYTVSGFSNFLADWWMVYLYRAELANEDQDNPVYDTRLKETLLYDLYIDKSTRDAATSPLLDADGNPIALTAVDQVSVFTENPGHVQWKTLNKWYSSKWTRNYPYINKYSMIDKSNAAGQSKQDLKGINNRQFRLGEILLDYAECLAQTGDLEGAVAQINKVRNRAGLPDLKDRVANTRQGKWFNRETNMYIDFNKDYPYEKFKTGGYTLADVMSIIDIEDAKENCFQLDRWQDLRRWGIADTNGDFYKRVAARSWKYQNNFQPHKVWFPIPTSEVDNNPNLDQNKDY